MDVSASIGRLSQSARDFIARRHKLLIDGQWVDAKSGKTFAVFDPSCGQQIAQVAEGVAEDVDAAVSAARRAFEEGAWPKMSPVERGKLVWKLGDVLEAHADELAELESLDNGKPIRDARAVDIPFGCELLRYMGGWSGPRSPARAFRFPRLATGTPTRCENRLVSLGRSSPGTFRC